MNPGEIWWGQIGNALRLLTAVNHSLRDCRSAVLQLPVRLPWRQTFRDTAAIRRTALGDNRSLTTIPWQEGRDPGDFILNQLCSRQVRANYYPGWSCAAYLGGLRDLSLNEQNIWITGIHRREDIQRWIAFLAEYERTAAQLPSRAVFLLEYDGPAVPGGSVEVLSFTVEDYDCRVFCLESGAALKNAAFREYQAELALRIGGGDPELSWHLLRAGEALTEDPVRTALDVVGKCRNSEGRSFPQLTEQQIASAAWRAALVILLPILEQWRMDFVARHESELFRHLPIHNSNGEKVTDPFDLELGALFFISRQPGCTFSPEDRARIELCREARNKLAHNRILSREEARAILKL